MVTWIVQCVTSLNYVVKSRLFCSRPSIKFAKSGPVLSGPEMAERIGHGFILYKNTWLRPLWIGWPTP